MERVSPSFLPSFGSCDAALPRRGGGLNCQGVKVPMDGPRTDGRRTHITSHQFTRSLPGLAPMRGHFRKLSVQVHAV